MSKLKDNLIIELQELVYKTANNFIQEHDLSIKSIEMDNKHTIITENGTIMDSPSMTKVYKLSNEKLNRELENG